MRPHGRRASVNPGNPEAFAVCDRCGFWYNRSALQWQYQWSGTHIYSLGILVCDICYDTPFEQLRTIILPPDPPPVINARPPNYTFEEGSGPAQGILAATVSAGARALPLRAADGPALSGASGFEVGQVIWVQQVDSRYSANISFGQYRITAVDVSSNILSIVDLTGEFGLSATAPVNGTVTVASTAVPQPKTAAWVGSAVLGGATSLVAASFFYNSVIFEGGSGLVVPVPPSWLQPYFIGTTVPLIFMDSVAGNYWYNGWPYAPATSWLTAIGGTYSGGQIGAAGKFVTNASGVLTQLAAGALPFNHDGSGNPLGILLEGASTNIALQSSVNNTSPWQVPNAATVTPNAATAPDGTTTAASIIEDSTNARHGAYQVLTGTDTTSAWTGSVYVKSNGTRGWATVALTIGGTFGVNVDLTTAAVTATVNQSSATNTSYQTTLLANGWIRVAVTMTANASANGPYFEVGPSNSASPTFGAFGFASYAGDGTSGIYAWGAQVEKLPFASSYIPTTASTATRAGDVLTIPWTSVTATFRTKTSDQIADSTYIGVNNPDLLGSGGTMQVIFQKSATALGTFSGANEVDGTGDIVSWASSNICGVSGDNSGRFITAGNNTPASDANKLFNSAPSNVYLGSYAAGSSPAYGHFQQFGAWTVKATSGQLQTMTNTT